ncbi:Cysteine-rich_membrane protein 2 [Hexamita inflata]|uniref:Cysteine-rich membrane protein 2 n=1 Tax=Hexamita inflata TaxID=28002 RepID=A0AA86QP58_9EUKA|nr:Cysteine-rich membrane protein 2 [Hexamita inflata]
MNVVQVPVNGQVLQPATAPTTVIVINNNVSKISCMEIVFLCQAPQFERCQCLCGFWTLIGGAGLECCCCYGCDRPDCKAVCCAGITLNLLSGMLYGLIVSSIVGCKMMHT